ncbi:hypothetical protein [Companilactobacillus sp.]|uniref:hypothetical protein n=1 Tax=Companilactobacillus sp. TaxID=2767905 RepID=UPI0025C62D15|nr:hypothetical protein [Companilactobacillus sp.]MCH4008971.1 hypothetical protein [Companilactobacillus sp.]MCH4050850.1 hypothetical protein [Companilactobacillus sp.]MCH4076914.1 hypothetical protein [Companilactobacillus sp.]MCH4125489.1 hypothetical protein [Companilactobacillus sp.]MCI1311198.1 hypothetical protein [Companilactobacillus sp.]
MLRKRSRRKSVNRKNISLVFVCCAIVVGIVGGLSLNMVQSSPSHNNPSFLEGSGSMTKTSDASVEVYDDRDDEGHKRPGTTNPGGGSVTNPGSRPGGSTGHGPNAGSQVGMRPVSNNASGDDTPSVIVDGYGHNKFPQTGEARDYLTQIGVALMGSLLMIIRFGRRIKVF